MPGPHRRIHRTDANQAEIVAALEHIGARVVSLASLGGGIPDLLVCFRKVTFLMECKMPKGARTQEQNRFLERWPGKVYTAYSAEMAVEQAVWEANGNG